MDSAAGFEGEGTKSVVLQFKALPPSSGSISVRSKSMGLMNDALILAAILEPGCCILSVNLTSPSPKSQRSHRVRPRPHGRARMHEVLVNGSWTLRVGPNRQMSNGEVVDYLQRWNLDAFAAFRAFSL